MNEIGASTQYETVLIDGRQLEVIVEFPEGPGPFPALIIAPGLRYDMHRPAIACPSNYLLSQGWAVFRFNWRFCTEDAVHGQPSGNLFAELDEFKQVLELARGDRRIDQAKISVAGKSFGSIVAWQLFMLEPDIKSCVLLTPLCSDSSSSAKLAGDELKQAREYYPGLEQDRRPLMMLSGDQDPYCELPMLYRFAARESGNLRLVVIKGDHSFACKTQSDEAGEAVFQGNMDLLGRHMENFLLDID